MVGSTLPATPAPAQLRRGMVDLALEPSLGLEGVYQLLATLRRRLGARSLTLVLSDPGLGRQVLRADRAPVRDHRSERVVRDAPDGLYADPPVSFPRAEVALLLRTTAQALALEVARSDASRDPLTGLHNRRSFAERLDGALALAARQDEVVTVALFDLDRFKVINDTHGHDAGDRALIAFGDALKAEARASDTVARLGGDEFAVVLLGAEDAIALALRVARTLASSHPSPSLRFSSGDAAYPQDGDTARSLLIAADRRLYREKHGA